MTMKGGNFSHVTSPPLTAPRMAQTSSAVSSATNAPDAPAGFRHHDGAQHHDRADGQVDTRGQDDHRLADGQNSDHHRLLQDEREVLRLEEGIGDQAEDHDGDDQRGQRPQQRLAQYASQVESLWGRGFGHRRIVGSAHDSPPSRGAGSAGIKGLIGPPRGAIGVGEHREIGWWPAPVAGHHPISPVFIH